VAQAVIVRTYLGTRTPGLVALPSLGVLLLGWAAFGLGVLVKGPVIAAVCIASIVAIVLWDRDWRWLGRLKPLPGLTVALLIVLPWAIAIGIASHGLFYQKSLGQDFATKLMGDSESHGAPPGYYTLLAGLIFWPGSLLLLPGLGYAIARRNEPAVRYLLVWAAATWLMFELAPTKLPHYVLPAFPALAILCALWLTSRGAVQTRAMRIAQFVSLALYVIAGLAFAVFLAWAPDRFGAGAPWWLYVAVAAAIAAILAVVPTILARRFTAAAMLAFGSAIFLYSVAGFLTVPRLTELWLSPRLADAVARHAQAGDPPVVTAGYAEPSIAFLLGTKTALDDGPGAGHAAAAAGGLVLISADQRAAFLDAITAEGARADALEEIAGLNYSRGRNVQITLYRVTQRAK
jgi:4-amino-4-deoxy-L-arabinose transferase-like glycosyltransferase